VRTEEGKLYLFVAIDRTSKFAYAQLHEKANRRTATSFLKALIKAVPYKIHTVLTDNGIQFTDLPKNRLGPRARWRVHMFDMLCDANGIEHRLTKPNHPWTNGQVEPTNEPSRRRPFSATITARTPSSKRTSTPSSWPITSPSGSRASKA
jgi:transposase InsO family protein